jgi:uncharacterized membrane protein
LSVTPVLWGYCAALALLVIGSLLVLAGVFIAEIEEGTERERGN